MQRFTDAHVFVCAESPHRVVLFCRHRDRLGRLQPPRRWLPLSPSSHLSAPTLPLVSANYSVSVRSRPRCPLQCPTSSVCPCSCRSWAHRFLHVCGTSNGSCNGIGSDFPHRSRYCFRHAHTLRLVVLQRECSARTRCVLHSVPYTRRQQDGRVEEGHRSTRDGGEQLAPTTSRVK